jgi:glucosamine--fructose-6-phosphate aminotransferase (isomerizing)
MCGIVGYTGSKPCRPLLLDGLSRLEYRGYDSAGIALAARDEVVTTRAVGNLDALRASLGDEAESFTGIGHTRWATHGRVSEENAHPLSCEQGRVHLVLNGIVENHLELRARLQGAGVRFSGQTDAEVVAHLVAQHYDRCLAAAVRAVLPQLEGHFAIVVMAADAPGVLVGTRRECPLVVGVGEHGHFFASAVAAFLPETRQVMELEDSDIVTLTPDGPQLDGAFRATIEVGFEHETPTRGAYDTFMRKEISDQPAAVARTLFDSGAIAIDPERVRNARTLRIVACGTSYNAGLVAQQLIEHWAGLPVEVDVASEYRYRTPLTGAGDLVLGISQSGETADTLAAMRSARERGAFVLALTNVEGTAATREADVTMYTRAGLEVGVAATKTFTAQVAALAAFAVRLGIARRTLSPEQADAIVQDLARLPDLIEQAIAGSEEWAERAALELADSPMWMFLGRGAGVAVAHEGALKLKEVSYVPSDAYAAGEMKHGPIALIGDGTPVVCIATYSPVLDKLLSNMAEVRTRGARVLAIATAGDTRPAAYADDVVEIPDSRWELQPLLAVIPLQLLAYRVASARGLNVDQPRNLAKTVTVE